MIHLANHPDLSNYNSVIVYLKDEAVHVVTIKGKVLSVDCDNYRIAVTTDKSYAVFNLDDVLAVNFE